MPRLPAATGGPSLYGLGCRAPLKCRKKFDGQVVQPVGGEEDVEEGVTLRRDKIVQRKMIVRPASPNFERDP